MANGGGNVIVAVLGAAFVIVGLIFFPNLIAAMVSSPFGFIYWLFGFR